ncbi:DNA primase [Melissococcus plutonius]|uniref:DNA primase n=1 Tax=Melissococcus plutonius TaxID=33970 RepID=UPI0021E5FC54|nr:DNA primase [Melissococcus plutonius]MCV2505149.1 DNA primase [Melissococcus plutonius]MCV2520064.1 DNA primase [Melissococcus plutonius]
MKQQIPQEVIEEIRHQTNIIDIVSQYVQLKKSGKNYMGLCPFHEERSPSFSVAEDKQIFHCFGCGKGGTIFNFIQEIEGISFPQAIKKVVEMENLSVSIDLNPIQATETPQMRQKRQLIEVHKKAVELYHHVLVNTKAGEEALKYLIERGLTREIIDTFMIGFAPMERDFLQRVFQNDQFDVSILDASGLFVKRDTGESFDRFYQRIVFPIYDVQNNPIAFSGRLLKTKQFIGENLPKYLNSPETLLFNKRETLFNFNQARKYIRKENTVFLFEGFMDVIAAWQSGIYNGIASMGTSLTNQQIRYLEKVSEKLVLCYDGDQAGIEATNRAIQLLNQQSRLMLSVLNLPEKLDPDDYVRKYGVDSFKTLATHEQQTVFSFKMFYHRQSRNMKNEKEQIDYVQTLLGELLLVPSPLERDHYMQQLAKQFNLSLHSLEEQFHQLKQKQRVEQRATKKQLAIKEPTVERKQTYSLFQSMQQQNKLPLSQEEKAEQTLIYRLMNEPLVRDQINNENNFSFIHDNYQELYLLLNVYLMEHNSFHLADFVNYLQNDEIKKLVIEIDQQIISEKSSEREINDLLYVIRSAKLKEKITEKKQQQKNAEKLGDKLLAEELTIEIIHLVQQLDKKRSII